MVLSDGNDKQQGLQNYKSVTMSKEIEKYQPGVKYPIVKSAFDLEATRLKYQELLQHISGLQVTRDNVNEDITKEARDVLKALTETKDTLSAEPLQWHKDIMENYKSLFNPIKEQQDRLMAEKKVVAGQIEQETRQQLAEQTRVNTAKSAIVTFVNRVAVLISEAKSDNDIVAIEKMIGLEKTKKNVYQEFLQELIDQSDGLRPQIKTQKESVRELQKVVEEEKKALETGDAVAAADLREKREHFEQVIQETGIRIHEKAFEQASTIDIVVPEIVDTAPKGRTNWKWRVDDIKTLQKKMPHLVKLVPDEEAIAVLLKTKRADGSLAGKDEENVFGLVFFNDKSFIK